MNTSPITGIKYSKRGIELLTDLYSTVMIDTSMVTIALSKVSDNISIHVTTEDAIVYPVIFIEYEHWTDLREELQIWFGSYTYKYQSDHKPLCASYIVEKIECIRKKYPNSTMQFHFGLEQ